MRRVLPHKALGLAPIVARAAPVDGANRRTSHHQPVAPALARRADLGGAHGVAHFVVNGAVTLG